MYIVFACYIQRSRDIGSHVQSDRKYALRIGNEVLAFALSARLECNNRTFPLTGTRCCGRVAIVLDSNRIDRFGNEECYSVVIILDQCEVLLRSISLFFDPVLEICRRVPDVSWLSG